VIQALELADDRAACHVRRAKRRQDGQLTEDVLGLVAFVALVGLHNEDLDVWLDLRAEGREWQLHPHNA
jgi:hypothetical protein